MSVTGRLFLRGEDGYEQARVGRIFNARKPDRFPAAILEVADEQDVVAGVRLAAERGWKVSVRSGGHSWAAWSVHDDALLLDLGALRSISYDEATGIVSAGPATMGSDAHAPSEVGSGLVRAREWLLEAGYRSVVVFRGRVPEEVSL